MNFGRILALAVTLVLLVWRLVSANDSIVDIEQLRSLWGSDRPAVVEAAAAALSQQPIDGRLYLILAANRESTYPEQALRLAKVGAQLAPRDVSVQLAAAAMMARHNQLDKALSGWSEALRQNPALGSQLHPLLAELARTSSGRAALIGQMTRSPDWWPAFYRYLARRIDDLEIVRTFYHESVLSNDAASQIVWQAFLRRLEQEGLWREAYFVWIDRVARSNLSVLGNLYNGDFNAPISNTGFGWRWLAPQGVTLDTGYAKGARSDRALKLSFDGREHQFADFYQPLLLPPGRYQLRGLGRTIELRDTAGLRWAVRCRSHDELGVSRRFAGNQRWQLFRIEFSVPDVNCDFQELRLELAENKAFPTRGEVWFDNMLIKRLRSDES